MKAMVLAAAARVGDSAFGRGWNRAGEILDVVIPLALTAVLVLGAASILFGLVQ